MLKNSLVRISRVPIFHVHVIQKIFMQNFKKSLINGLGLVLNLLNKSNGIWELGFSRYFVKTLVYDFFLYLALLQSSAAKLLRF